MGILQEKNRRIPALMRTHGAEGSRRPDGAVHGMPSRSRSAADSAGDMVRGCIFRRFSGMPYRHRRFAQSHPSKVRKPHFGHGSFHGSSVTCVMFARSSRTFWGNSAGSSGMGPHGGPQPHWKQVIPSKQSDVQFGQRMIHLPQFEKGGSVRAMGIIPGLIGKNKARRRSLISEMFGSILGADSGVVQW